MTEFKINDTVIGGDNPCYIIAELSANHNQDFEIAIKSIRAIKDTGANAVKIQSYTPGFTNSGFRTVLVQNKGR